MNETTQILNPKCDIKDLDINSPIMLIIQKQCCEKKLKLFSFVQENIVGAIQLI